MADTRIPKDQNCSLCKFFGTEQNMPDQISEGRNWCVRYPPTVVFYATSKEPFYQLTRFPDVNPNWWCGEFVAA